MLFASFFSRQSIHASLFQTRCFSKYVSRSRAKRLPLTTKKAGKGYSKGYGARKEGKVNSKGNFVSIPGMRTELVVPDFTNFNLKPYIAAGVKKNIREVSPVAQA